MKNPFNTVVVAEEAVGRELTEEEAILLDLVSTINATGGVVDNMEGSYGIGCDEEYLDLGDVVIRASDLLTEKEIPHTLKGYTYDEDEEDKDEEEELGLVKERFNPEED